MLKLQAKQNANGVKITFGEAVTKEHIEAMVAGCASGECSCSCDPQLRSRITGIRVGGEKGAVELELEGEGLEAEALKEAVQSCCETQL
jgi:hypothetical protein